MRCVDIVSLLMLIVNNKISIPFLNIDCNTLPVTLKIVYLCSREIKSHVTLSAKNVDIAQFSPADTKNNVKILFLVKNENTGTVNIINLCNES